MATSRRGQTRGHARIAAAKAAREKALRRRQQRPYVIGGAIVLVLVVVGVALLARSGSDSPDQVVTSPGTTIPATSAAFTYGTGACAPAETPAAPTIDFSGTGGFQQCLDPSVKYVATFATSAGEVKVELDQTRTPGTTNNFVQLAGYGYYTGTKLFRTDPSIGIIQGGAPHTNSGADPGPGFTITDEGGTFTYQPGQLVMARTTAPNSASAQFFFTVDDKVSSLDSQGTYVVIGTVISGLDVLQKILATDAGGAPSPEVTVTSVTIGGAQLVPGA